MKLSRHSQTYIKPSVLFFVSVALFIVQYPLSNSTVVPFAILGGLVDTLAIVLMIAAAATWLLHRRPAHGRLLPVSAAPNPPVTRRPELDPLYGPALRAVAERGMASAALLQLQLQIPYATAAYLLQRMEDDGLVGPMEGAHPRLINVARLKSVLSKSRPLTMPSEK